jgi:serine/threonine-protein kinase SRPK3
MPQRKSNKGKDSRSAQKVHGKKSSANGNGKSNHSGQHKKPKHEDPTTASPNIDELVKFIEEGEAPPISPPAATAAPAAPKPPAAPKSTKAERRRNKKDPFPTKAGMTNAQRQELRRSEAMKSLIINAPDPDFDDGEDEDADQGGGNSGEDYSDTQNERAKEYRKGGYHPVVVGEVYNNRYRIVKKLGWGYFSTVWLVWDYETGTYQAMKVQKSAEHYRDAAYDEIKLLSQIMEADPHKDRCCARMNDFFEHVGPHGTHVCMAFDVLGENLLSLIERYEYHGIPIPIVKSIAQQVLIGLEHIHSIDIIHTDLKPENVLLSAPKHKIFSIMKHYQPPQLHVRPSLLARDVKMMTKSQKRRYYKKLKDQQKSGKGGDNEHRDEHEGEQEDTGLGSANNHEALAKDVLAAEEGNGSDTDPEWEIERFHNVCLADFGNSCWTHKQFTDEVQTRQYRSPEVIVGNGYSTAIDLWSCACMIFELLTGEFLFDPKPGADYSRDEDHLALMSELLGELPETIRLGNGKYRSNFYTSKGELRHIKDLKYWGLVDVLHGKHRFTKKKAMEISEFLMPMLACDPNERATATYMLNNFSHFFQVQDDDYAPACFNPQHKSDESAEEDDGYEDEEDEDRPAENTRYERSRDNPHRSHHRVSSADESDLQQWWESHPLLNEAALEARGLTIGDVQRALKDLPLETPEKEASAQDLLKLLASSSFDDDTNDDMRFDDEKEEEEEEDDDDFNSSA